MVKTKDRCIVFIGYADTGLRSELNWKWRNDKMDVEFIGYADTWLQSELNWKWRNDKIDVAIVFIGYADTWLRMS
jgi:hypothetical protein